MNRSYSKIRAMQELNLIVESRFITERKKHKSLISEAYSAQPGEGYDGGVEACKKELPYNVITKAGKNWNEVKKAWGSSGTAQENLVLRDAWCQGWRPGDAKDGGTGTPTEQKPGEQQNVTGREENTVSIDDFIKKEIESLPNFSPDKFEIFKKLPNLTQGTIGQYNSNDLISYPSLKDKLPAGDFLYWVSNQQKPGEAVEMYFENGLIVKMTNDKKDFQILGNWQQGDTPKPGNQPVDDKKYSEEYVIPTFG